jgi:hypothetical protein
MAYGMRGRHIVLKRSDRKDAVVYRLLVKLVKQNCREDGSSRQDNNFVGRGR